MRTNAQQRKTDPRLPGEGGGSEGRAGGLSGVQGNL